MFRLIVNFFKGIGVLLNGTAKFAVDASKSLENSADEMLKASTLSRARAAEKYKKDKAQMVIDGGYESEEAMDKAHDELLESITKRPKR
ncbi:hypothetical protein [Psychrobacter faecalis]|uniref:hypothetical protein n=1 Tax=Psychrobacter faecalis TaxID=180588 RepID=UPI0028AD1D42|nr:hypothetical protein [Psychrobacter faecalis]